MTIYTRTDIPFPNAPLAGPDGQISEVWWRFLLELFTRTGGTSGTTGRVDAVYTDVLSQTFDTSQIPALPMLEMPNKYPDAEQYQGNALSTGVVTGLVVSMGVPGSTSFAISAGMALVVSNEPNASVPYVTRVTYAGATGLTSPYLATADETYIFIDQTGTIQYFTANPTAQQRRQMVLLGKVTHPNRTTYNYAVSFPDIAYSGLSQIREYIQGIGPVNDGIYPSSNGVNLTFKTSAGQLQALGINYKNNLYQPTELDIAAQAPVSFLYRTQTNAGGTTTVTNIDPNSYDAGGTVTAIGGGSNSSTNQRIYMTAVGVVVVQYGQTVYTSLANAIAGINSEPFVTAPNLVGNAILIGILSVTKGTTDLSDITKARFLISSKFGEVVGSAAGVTTATLQSAYNNSIVPNITTNSTLGGLSIKRGSAADTDNILYGQNGAGSTTFSVTGVGVVTGSKLVTTGGTSAQYVMGDGSLTSGTSSAATSTPRNRIINGSMEIDQRHSGAAQTITAGAALAYTVDRFYAYCTGANVTGQRVAGSGQTPYRYQFTGAASVTAIGFGTRLEAINTYDLNSQTATFAVDLANSLLTTVTWTAYYANTTDTFGTLASPTRTQIATGTFTVNNTVTRYSAQISIPAAATTGIEVVLTVGAQTSGTWTIGNTQLELGSSATAFEVRDYGDELRRCLRYYWYRPLTIAGATLNTTTCTAPVLMFPQAMRVIPTLDAGAAYEVSSGSAGTPRLLSGAGYRQSVYGTYFDNSAANWTANVLVSMSGGFNAEL